MKKSKWPDFLFTIAVRFICGMVLGGVACSFFTWKGILRAFSHNDTIGPLVWLGICGLIGGVVAVFTVPRWQTPWYRRDAWVQDSCSELGSLGQGRATRGSEIV